MADLLLVLLDIVWKNYPVFFVSKDSFGMKFVVFLHPLCDSGRRSRWLRIWGVDRRLQISRNPGI